MALPYTTMSTYVSEGNAATIYSDIVWRTSENRNVLTMLEGGPESYAPIIRFSDPLKKGGEVFSHDFISGIMAAGGSASGSYSPEPKKMDFDTHSFESIFEFDTQTVTLLAWREVIMTSVLMKQKPAYDMERACIEGLSDYHALKSGTYGLKAILHQTWTGSNSSGTLYDASAGTNCPTNQVVAGDNANVSQLGSDDIFTGELIDRGLEVAFSGERRDGEYTFRMKRPQVAGRQYEAVVLMTQFQFFDLKNNDPKFREEAIYTLERGKSHPAWVGFSTMLEYKGCLIIVLTDELEDIMKFTTSSSIWDEDGTARTPSVAGATAVMLFGRAAMRVTGSRENFFNVEGWDNNWFTRIGTGRMEGFARVKIENVRATIDNSFSDVSRDFGTVLIHTAASHHNVIAGP